MMPDNLLTNAFVSLDLVGVVVVGGVEPVVVVVATAIGYCARARLSDNCCSKSDPATTDPDCAIGSEVKSLYCPFFFRFSLFSYNRRRKLAGLYGQKRSRVAAVSACVGLQPPERTATDVEGEK
jgi:hypothetical protein